MKCTFMQGSGNAEEKERILFNHIGSGAATEGKPLVY